jgi:hypothetical protein
MTNSPGSRHVILLMPLEDTEAAPLRRWLGREAWLRDPGVVLRYERDRDRVMVRLVDMPSTAVGSVSRELAQGRHADLFIGFDGADASAWPTTIALLGFSWHQDRDTSQLGIVRALVGGEVWATVAALRQTPGVDRELPISQTEASRLIRQWGDLVVSLDDVGPTDESISEALEEWSAAMQLAGRPALGRSARPAPPPWLPSAALRSRPGAVSRSAAGRRISVADAGRPVEGTEPSRGGAAMARRLPPPASDGEPSRPVRYGPLARLSDRWAARRDGNSGVPPVRPGADPTDRRLGLTPYLEIRNRHFLDWAEREHRRMLTDLDGAYRTRAEVHQQIAGADERAATIRKVLDSMPKEPPDPVRRNAIEQHAPEELVRARRRREFEAEYAEVVAQDQQAVKVAQDFRVQEAQLSETIAARERVLDSRVRQLHAHSLRRCATYKRHIVHHHPDGNAVLPYLDLALPDLPDWIQGLGSAGTQTPYAQTPYAQAP